MKTTPGVVAVVKTKMCWLLCLPNSTVMFSLTEPYTRQDYSLLSVILLPKTSKRKFSVGSCAVMAKACTKKCNVCVELLLCILNVLLF